MTLLEDVVFILRGVAAVFAAFLPRRRWDALGEIPVERMAALSGLLTAATGAVLGGLGFMAYARRAAEGAVNATLHIAERQVRNELPGEITSVTTQGVSALSVVAFLFFTPLGLAAIYLVVTGILRAVAAWVDDPFGDPVLTGLDALVSRSARGAHDARVRRNRERAEGSEVPDRLLPADIPGFDLFVVSSRQKPDWTPGTFVITSEKWYTLGQAFEIRLPEGLRTIYPLEEQKTTEVLRRAVEYDLPPLEQAHLPGRRP